MKIPASLLLLLIPFLALADEVVPIESVKSFVNVRMLPDSASEIVGRLEQGKSARLVESIPAWHEIEIEGGVTGFISADWTRVIAEAETEVGEAETDIAEAETDVAEAGELLSEAGVAENPDDEATGPAPVTESAGGISAASEPAVTLSADSAAETATEAAVADTAAAADTAESVAENAVSQAPLPVALSPAADPPMQSMKGNVGFLTKFTSPTEGGRSLIFDDGNNIGIGTTEPKQRLEVNGNIQIHEQNSSVAGLMITQAGGETGYIMHNRASTLTIGAGSVDRITIGREGNVGFGVSRPANPLEMASGAHVTAGGVWTNSSSRERKEHIMPLDAADALATLTDLQPVRFNYKNDRVENYVGFIAEDVPDLVATADREGLSAMDIVAVLTKVVQEQQKKILELEARIEQR